MKIVEGVYWIKGANANCFMVVDDELTLIDTGFPRNAKKITEFIKQDLHRGTRPS